MGETGRVIGLFSIALALVVSCAAPTPTATPTTAPVAAPTPTKAPTATPTKMPLTKITYVAGTYGSLDSNAAFVGKAKGYYQEEGLDIDWVTIAGGAKGLAAVVGGSAHIGQGAAQEVVSATSQGSPARAFALFGTGRALFMVIQKTVADQRGITPRMSLAEKAKALKGLTFGATSPGSGTDNLVRYFLSTAGLDPDHDVEISYIGSTAALAPAFNTGSIDIVTSSSADATLEPIRRGKGAMLVNFAAGDDPGTAEVLGDSAFGHRDEMQARPEIFEALVRAVWRAQRDVAQNPNEAKEIVRKSVYPDMEPGLFDDYWKAMLPSFPASPVITEKAFQATLDFRNKTEKGPPLTAKFSDFYEPRFVEAAKKQLGF